MGWRQLDQKKLKSFVDTFFRVFYFGDRLRAVLETKSDRNPQAFRRARRCGGGFLSFERIRIEKQDWLPM